MRVPQCSAIHWTASAACSTEDFAGDYLRLPAAVAALAAAVGADGVTEARTTQRSSIYPRGPLPSLLATVWLGPGDFGALSEAREFAVNPAERSFQLVETRGFEPRPPACKAGWPRCPFMGMQPWRSLRGPAMWRELLLPRRQANVTQPGLGVARAHPPSVVPAKRLLYQVLPQACCIPNVLEYPLKRNRYPAAPDEDVPDACSVGPDNGRCVTYARSQVRHRPGQARW